MTKARSFFKFFVLALALANLVSCASKEKEKKLKKAELHFSAGTQYLMEQQYTEALRSLRTADEMTPDNPEILNNLAMAYYFKGEKDIAIKLLQKSIKLKPEENSDARMNIGSIQYKEGDYIQAEKMYRHVLKDLTYEKQARNLYNLGVLELEIKKNSVAAEDFFKKSIKEDDNYCPSYFQLGLIHYKRRQFKTALRNFKESTMGVCYEAPAGHYYQALTLLELKRFTDARLKFDEVDTRFKKSVYAVKARAKALEINEIEKNSGGERSHASRRLIETSDF